MGGGAFKRKKAADPPPRLPTLPSSLVEHPETGKKAREKR